MTKGRIIVRILFLIAALMVVGALIATSSRRTVGSDSKAAQGIRYGYQLESYRFRNRMYLRFWNSAGLSLDLDLPGYSAAQVDEARWLAGDGAIYLRTTVVQRDGAGEKSAPVRILFDFRKNELLISSVLPIGRLPDDPTKWLTDEQFDAALKTR